MRNMHYELMHYEIINCTFTKSLFLPSPCSGNITDFSARDYTRTSLPPDARKMGIHDEGYVSRVWLYFFFGALGAMWQATAYWIMGAMSNDPAKLAYFSGLCTHIYI
jgi:hypothetical protein